MIKFKDFFDHVDEYCFVQGNSNVKHFNCDRMKELDKNFSNMLQGPLILDELDRFVNEFDVRLTCDPIGIVRDTASRGITDFLLANNRDNHGIAIHVADSSRAKPTTVDKIDVLRFDKEPGVRGGVSSTYFRSALVDNWIDNDSKLDFDPWNKSMAANFMAKEVAKKDRDSISLMEVYFDLDFPDAFTSYVESSRSIRKNEIDTHLFENLNEMLLTHEGAASNFATKFITQRFKRGLLPALAFNKRGIIDHVIERMAATYGKETTWADDVFYHDKQLVRDEARAMVNRGSFLADKYAPIARSIYTAMKNGTAEKDDMHVMETALDKIVEFSTSNAGFETKYATKPKARVFSCNWFENAGAILGMELVNRIIHRLNKTHQQCITSKLATRQQNG